MRLHSDEYKTWLANLKEGDEVAIPRHSWDGGTWDVRSVERTTETQLVLANGTRYRRDFGRAVGKATGYIQPVTPEIRDANEYSELKRWAYTLETCIRNRTNAPTLAQLRAMKTAFDEAAPK